MTTKKEIADRYGVTVLALQPNEDATALVGEPVLEVAADSDQGPATLYVNDRTGALEWDVSGYPGWYRGPQ